MASSLGAPLAIEAGEVYTLRQSAARHPDHGRSMALGLDCDRPMAIAAGPAIFPERNSAACLVCAGNLGVGRRAAMAGASGTGVRARARTGDGSGAGAAAVHERNRGVSRSLVVPGRGLSRDCLHAAVLRARAARHDRVHAFGQPGRIDEALSAVARDKSPNPKAYFLGFAGVGDEKVFAQEIGLASRVLGERYDMTARTLSLINDQRDLERAPLATVSGLKYALRGLASRMNLDQDVLFLSISSHGAKDPAIIVSNSELPLQDLTDDDLADALSESGIKWRVIVISACYAGAFIESLRDPQTIVITASAADRTSFGCSNDRDLTYFGEAFYRDALPTAHSLREAFDTAKSTIAARERREHVDASNPQAYFGKAMEAKLASMSPPQP